MKSESTPEIVRLSWEDVNELARKISREIDSRVKDCEFTMFGVPRGGIFAAQAIASAIKDLKTFPSPVLVQFAEDADFIVDDIIDSGKTKESFQHLKKPFFALVDKIEKKDNRWYEFPWERMSKETPAEENVARIIQSIGDDPNREGLKETPKRVIKAYSEIFSGYRRDVKDVVKTFKDGKCDEMVISKDIEFYSMCEHHMLPFFGKAHIAYIPGKAIVGLSKLARILEIFSRRLQVQERLTTQITEAIDATIDPQGSACVIEAKHLCCMSRGIGKQGSSFVTSSLTGVFRKPEVRAEFFNLINR